MLLKLIKARPMPSGTHCELWEVNHLFGDRHLANVFVLTENLPLELIYRLTVTRRGICIQGQACGWEWTSPMEKLVTEYLLSVQSTGEEIRIEIASPEPDLPGYPQVDYHPDDFPIVFGDFE